MFVPIAAALFAVLQAPLSHPAPEVPIVTWETSLKGTVTETDGPLLRLSGGSGWSRSLVPELDYILRLQYRLATPDAHGAAQPTFSGAKGTLVSSTEILVGVDGNVQGVRLTKSSRPDFDAAALAAAWKWQFTPAVVNGRPVPVIVKIDPFAETPER